jgi:neutral amino acid transport system ATP-binding protein
MSSTNTAGWTSGALVEPGAAKPDPILAAHDVRRAFGGLVAVDVRLLEVQRGSITALIGPNGAGKTTLFNLLTGFDRPDSGRWSFDGTDVTAAPAHRVSRAGMVRTFQLTKALSRMSVLDNMMVGANQPGDRLRNALLAPRWRTDEENIRDKAIGLLEEFRLADLRNDYAGTLSGGQRKLLEMARALMSEPRLLMLDEPMAGVNPALVQSLLDRVRGVRDQGTTVLFVEHDMDVVMGISDWVVCMAEGSVIAEGPPLSVAADQRVIDAYLGARHDQEPQG